MTEPANSERALARAVREVAGELGVRLDVFSQDWVFRLEGVGRVGHIFGYNFDLNGAAGQQIAGDKCAAYELLTHSGIAAVEHRLFLRPNLAGYVAGAGNWRDMLSYFEGRGSDVVCKSNTGTGGNQVYRARTPLELETAAHKLFATNRAVALSPFLDIEAEYRLVMLGGTCELAYEKLRPQAQGDGRSTLLELILRDPSHAPLTDRLIAGAQEDGVSLSRVPERGEWVSLSWKHNLGKGARAVELADETLRASLSKIALSCMDALALDFASVDIIRRDDELLVMEINSGVMMESYAQQGAREYETAKGIYRKAVLRMLS